MLEWLTQSNNSNNQAIRQSNNSNYRLFEVGRRDAPPDLFLYLGYLANGFCRFARKLLFILYGITPPYVNVPHRSENVAYLSSTLLCATSRLDVASFFVISLFDMFPLFFPF
jgi:hypothetical protein